MQQAAFAPFFVIYKICLSWFFEGAHKIQTNAAPSIMKIGKMRTKQKLQEKFPSTKSITRICNQMKILKLLICWIFRSLYSNISMGRGCQTITSELTSARTTCLWIFRSKMGTYKPHKVFKFHFKVVLQVRKICKNFTNPPHPPHNLLFHTKFEKKNCQKIRGRKKSLKGVFFTAPFSHDEIINREYTLKYCIFQQSLN